MVFSPKKPDTFSGWRSIMTIAIGPPQIGQATGMLHCIFADRPAQDT